MGAASVTKGALSAAGKDGRALGPVRATLNCLPGQAVPEQSRAATPPKFGAAATPLTPRRLFVRRYPTISPHNQRLSSIWSSSLSRTAQNGFRAYLPAKAPRDAFLALSGSCGSTSHARQIVRLIIWSALSTLHDGSNARSSYSQNTTAARSSDTLTTSSRFLGKYRGRSGMPPSVLRICSKTRPCRAARSVQRRVVSSSSGCNRKSRRDRPVTIENNLEACFVKAGNHFFEFAQASEAARPR
jgi:hypothetical protein